MQHFDIRRVFSSEYLRDLITLKTDAQSYLSLFRFIFNRSAGRFSAFILFLPHEGNVIKQSILFRILLIGIGFVQRIHICIIIINRIMTDNGRYHQFRIIRNSSCVLQCGCNLNIVTVIGIYPLYRNRQGRFFLYRFFFRCFSRFFLFGRRLGNTLIFLFCRFFRPGINRFFLFCRFFHHFRNNLFFSFFSQLFSWFFLRWLCLLIIFPHLIF